MAETHSLHPSEQIRQNIRQYLLADETEVVRELIRKADLSVEDRTSISSRAAELIRSVRSHSTPTMMEKFLGEYGLSTKEGVALMCLAEALLRVPDTTTIDTLIEDKITSGNWSEHLGQSNSSLVNMSTWALLITGKLTETENREGLVNTLKGMVKRLGEPVIRTAVAQAMKELGRQFVLGRTIPEACKNADKYQSKGYTYSYDMLGEAARTEADAQRYFQAYSSAIHDLSNHCSSNDIRENPGISVKLSALHARYEYSQHGRVMAELVPRTLQLAQQAKAANMGFNIDAEEADRLDISLDVIEAVLSDPSLSGWDGFGVVVQAYGRRASYVLDWLYELSVRVDRKIMVRLVKGAYWDAEIKRAQTLGLESFPVFTRKVNTDVSYLSCAKKLLGMTDRIYPQFATHNAHSVTAILHLADKNQSFEFQRLHGMGESLHAAVVDQHQTRCRIYAPVGAHKELLAYLVRRLLENGANSSFVNQIVDTSIPPEAIAKDPFALVESLDTLTSQVIDAPANLYGEGRRNAKGWDFTDPVTVSDLDHNRSSFQCSQWQAKSILAEPQTHSERTKVAVINPAVADDIVGYVELSTKADVEYAITSAQTGFKHWSQIPVEQRAEFIRSFAQKLEDNAEELFALMAREAGKTIPDAIAEIREAVDFALYYPNEAVRQQSYGSARGVITCISPWNFPLAIFAGQILAALAAGNVVLAKPADQTALIAARTIELMHEAGIPKHAVQLLPGDGPTIGAALTSDSRIAGVCFTGSTATAQSINRAMADYMLPQAPLIAETGGLNAMIVDSTALPEQVIRDVIASAFQSAGQRCSALRVLYLQKDIAEPLLEMLYGAMDELQVGNPWQLSTDVGPVIDSAAKQKIDNHCQAYKEQGRLLKSLPVPEEGLFVAPSVIRLNSISELDQEIFGPVLHVVTFAAEELDQVIDSINDKGFGLTFGLHTRVDSRVAHIIDRIKVGNIYVNRNQIGAIVGSQPFGGEGLSGTGPKAGGPHYLSRFMQPDDTCCISLDEAELVPAEALQKAINSLSSETSVNDNNQGYLNTSVMPGPTGEKNQLSTVPRGVVLCLGPDKDNALKQARQALDCGNQVVVIAPDVEKTVVEWRQQGLAVTGINGSLAATTLQTLEGFAAVVSVADHPSLRAYRTALAARTGAILPLITEQASPERYVLERHLCVDTTAAGGNASLIALGE